MGRYDSVMHNEGLEWKEDPDKKEKKREWSQIIQSWITRPTTHIILLVKVEGI